MKRNAGIVIISGRLVHWKLEDFLRMDRANPVSSPSFICAGKKWELSLYPIGNQDGMCRGWMYARLENRTDDDVSFRIRFSLIGCDGRAIADAGADWTGWEYFQSQKLISRSELEFLRERVLPGGALNLVCQIDTPGDSGDWRLEQEKSKVGSKESKNSGTTYEADGIVKLELLSKSVLKLQQDLEWILFYGTNSDVTLMLTGRSYMAHKAILAARSPAFSEMFQRDAKTAASRAVLVEFGNVDSFSDFLHYLYTGKESDVTPENARDLYDLAVAYRVDQLKAVCLKLMIESVSTERFCDLQTFALRYSEPELTDALERFFLVNWKDVIPTSKWEVFINANTALGYELLMKARKVGSK